MHCSDGTYECELFLPSDIYGNVGSRCDRIDELVSSRPVLPVVQVSISLITNDTTAGADRYGR